MSILLSNDDGVFAPGLAALYRELKTFYRDLRTHYKAQSTEYDICVVAPNRDRSGVSNCLTLDRPLQCLQLDNGFYSVDGTPTDCVHLGTANMFMEEPERVFSGINYGANMGDDVLYSGTVAAAMEGRCLAKPSVAFSLVTDRAHNDAPDFSVAAGLAGQLVSLVDSLEFPPRTVFNINIPDLPRNKIKGVRLTRLGQRLRSETPISTLNPRGKTLYWIGRAGGPVEMTEGTDFAAVEAGYVSVTPLHADMTVDLDEESQNPEKAEQQVAAFELV